MKYFFITALVAGLLFSCDQNNRENENKSEVDKADSVESYDNASYRPEETDNSVGDAIRGAGKDVGEAGKDVGQAVSGAASDVKDVFTGQTPAEEAAEDRAEARQDAQEAAREAAEDTREND